MTSGKRKRSSLKLEPFLAALKAVDHKPIKRKNATGFYGVCKDKRTGRFIAYVDFHKKRYNSTVFNTAIEAAQAYDFLSFKLRGNQAMLNFPPTVPFDTQDKHLIQLQHWPRYQPLRAANPSALDANTECSTSGSITPRQMSSHDREYFANVLGGDGCVTMKQQNGRPVLRIRIEMSISSAHFLAKVHRMLGGSLSWSLHRPRSKGDVGDAKIVWEVQGYLARQLAEVCYQHCLLKYTRLREASRIFPERDLSQGDLLQNRQHVTNLINAHTRDLKDSPPDSDISDSQLAGILDTEGCVGWYSSKATIMIAQSKADGFLNRLKTKWGGSVARGKSWTLSNQPACERFAQNMLPHCLLKKSQLKALLQLITMPSTDGEGCKKLLQQLNNGKANDKRKGRLPKFTNKRLLDLHVAHVQRALPAIVLSLI